MIYRSIQNVLAVGITVGKIEDQVNQIAHISRRFSKRKNEIPLKDSEVMINARA